MKNIFLPSMVFFAISTMHAQVVNIPDTNFKNALVSIKCADLDNDGSYESDVDTNNDGEIQITEAEAISGLQLEFKQIGYLTGIEVFKNLKVLNCSHNQLTSLDVTNISKLVHLNCSYNQLTSLDVTNNTELTELNCADNQLTNLDVTKNTELMWLDCWDNPLTNLDVTKNTKLTVLDCENSQLTSLDLSKNTELTEIECSYNKLTSLDVTNISKLVHLNCSNNQLTSLDFNSNPSLVRLSCGQDSLKFLSIKNGNNLFEELVFCKNDDSRAYLAISNSPNLAYICADEAELECVQMIVDSLGYSQCKLGLDCITGIQDNLSISNYFNVFPNPSSGAFTIEVTEAIQSITIHDLSGRVLQTVTVIGNRKEIEVSTQNLSKGTYFVSVKTGKNKYVKKLMKN